ncbi:hypothetical protein SLEP1_g49582 [Rubroshorea leprosula]|uniref:SWIM-type domain-containing protein n=1 Tax=Rubroshorea leprosula TaxID=152421 RepID=A0AAV5LXF5_9ROSI|nr:hypothetical protein SLEP1_g49582 [Rubroshorea leprosula]
MVDKENCEINSVSKYGVPLIKLKACQQVQSRKQIQYGHEIDISFIGHDQCIIPTTRATICWCITPTSWVERTGSITTCRHVLAFITSPTSRVTNNMTTSETKQAEVNRKITIHNHFQIIRTVT